MTQAQQIKDVLLGSPHGLYLREITEATGLPRQNINRALRSMEVLGEVKVVMVGLRKYLPTKLLSVPKAADAEACKPVKTELPRHATGPIVARPLTVLERML